MSDTTDSIVNVKILDPDIDIDIHWSTRQDDYGNVEISGYSGKYFGSKVVRKCDLIRCPALLRDAQDMIAAEFKKLECNTKEVSDE